MAWILSSFPCSPLLSALPKEPSKVQINDEVLFSFFDFDRILLHCCKIIYMFVTKTNMDLIYYFTFCILIWCIFHGLFISIVNSFIRALEDRPAQKGTNVKMIDKNLRDLMLSSNTGNM